MSERGPETNRTTAEVRRGWWPGWIWAVPIAALLVVGWLGIRALTSGGEDVTIAFDNAHGIKPQDTSIEYRGMKIGSVSDVALSQDGRKVLVTASIDESATRYLKTGTLFWLQGANPSLSNLSSLGSVLSGPTIIMAPGPGKATTHFNGLARQPAVAQTAGPSQNYEVSFAGAVGSLALGDAVKLEGFTVGKVEEVGFRYDARTGSLETPVTIALFPSLFRMKGASPAASLAALRAAISSLIQKGLRANLDQDPPLIGSYRVSLEMVAGAPPATPAVVDGMPQIPVAPSGGLNSIVNRFNKVPIDQIAQNVLDITKHLDEVVSSPKLKDAVAELDASLKQIRTTVGRVGPQVTALAGKLRDTADQLDETAKAADKTLGGTPSQHGLDKTMREISDAARSVRSLADYLDRHPEALIKGRSGD
jgi:paraquat-inducible protein B